MHDNNILIRNICILMIGQNYCSGSSHTNPIFPQILIACSGPLELLQINLPELEFSYTEPHTTSIVCEQTCIDKNLHPICQQRLCSFSLAMFPINRYNSIHITLADHIQTQLIHQSYKTPISLPNLTTCITSKQVFMRIYILSANYSVTQ